VVKEGMFISKIQGHYTNTLLQHRCQTEQGTTNQPSNS